MSECINKVIGYLGERMVLLKILFKDWETKIEVKETWFQTYMTN